MARDFENFARLAKYRQILSQCLEQGFSGHFGTVNSVPRSGEIWNFLVIWFLSKVAQMHDEFLGYCEK